MERGFKAEESAVIVVGAHGPRQVVNLVSTTAKGLMTTIADSMAVIGTYNMYRGGEVLLVLGPTHARILAGERWSKEDVKRCLFEKVRRPLGQLKEIGCYNVGGTLTWPEWVDTSDNNSLVPIIHRPEDLLVIVSGGEVGGYSSLVFCWGIRSITRAIPAS